LAPTQSAEEGKRKKERVNTTDQHRAKKIEVMVVQISKRVQFGVGLFFEFR
jgi:predicted component of type VI protein secretion system